MRLKHLLAGLLVAGLLMLGNSAFAQAQFPTVDANGNRSGAGPIGVVQMCVTTAGADIGVGIGVPCGTHGTTAASAGSSGSTIPSAYTSNLGPISVGTTSTAVLAAGAATHTLTLYNNGTTGNLWLNMTGGAAVVGAGMRIPAGSGYIWSSGVTAAINGISDAGTLSVSGSGG